MKNTAASVVKFDCPKCGQPIETTRLRSLSSVECPTCRTGFMPGRVFEIEPEPSKGWTIEAKAREPDPVWQRDLFGMALSRTGPRGRAGIVSVLGILCFLGCAVCLFLALLNSINSDNYWFNLSAASGLLLIGFILQIIAQLLHIRAALEDRRDK